MDFKEIVNIIFNEKHRYREIIEKDKIDSFYIINKKFGLKHPKIAQFFNDKNIDKASAIDMWFLFFRKENKIPYWYWSKSNFKKDKKSKLSKKTIDTLEYEYEISKNDILFLEENYKDDIDYEIKILKKFKKL